MNFFKRYSYLANGVAELLQEHLTSLFWAIAAAQLPHGVSAALKVDFGVSSASSETTIGDAVEKCHDNKFFSVGNRRECYTLDLIEATYVLSRLDTQSVHQVYLSLLVSLIINEREPLEPHEGARPR